MKYLRFPFKLNNSKTLTVEFDKPVSIMVFVDGQFQRYKEGASCKYFGGLQKDSPYVKKLPGGYKYHLVIELGKYDKKAVNPRIELVGNPSSPQPTKDPVIAELDAILDQD